MPDRPLTRDTHEVRPHLDTTIIMGIAAVCVLLALMLFGARMIQYGDLNTTQPSAQSPATGENKTP